MITIDYFSDVLCVWAYGGQVRVDELKREFGEQVVLRQRFMDLFGDTETRIGVDWQDKGGFDGFGAYIREVCDQWHHTRLHPDVWSACRPRSCVTAHVFLKAVSLCLRVEDDSDERQAAHTGFDDLVARVRHAFFEQALDISNLQVLETLLTPCDVSPEAVRSRIDNGEAYAALHRDAELARTYGVQGSPTYVFNAGRQLLYGNVGYRIIESNARELLTAAPLDGAPSWC